MRDSAANEDLAALAQVAQRSRAKRPQRSSSERRSSETLQPVMRPNGAPAIRKALIATGMKAWGRRRSSEPAQSGTVDQDAANAEGDAADGAVDRLVPPTCIARYGAFAVRYTLLESMSRAEMASLRFSTIGFYLVVLVIMCARLPLYATFCRVASIHSRELFTQYGPIRLLGRVRATRVPAIGFANISSPHHLIVCCLSVTRARRYIPFAEASLVPFSCVTGEDGVQRLRDPASTSVVCDWSDPDWSRMVPISNVCVLVYTIGIPVCLGMALHYGYRLSIGQPAFCGRLSSERHGGMQDPAFEQAFGPLYIGFFVHACACATFQLGHFARLMLHAAQRCSSFFLHT